jgi:two-component system, chemotaxis family, chemotaxis protein CheY
MGTKIMVVDDSALSRRLMRKILESGGHDVIEASDGMSALESYALEKPAVVMLDLVMSGMYGLEVLAELRTIDPEARVVIASADIQRATRDEALAAGAFGFVSKPFQDTEVLGTIERAATARDRAR